MKVNLRRVSPRAEEDTLSLINSEKYTFHLCWTGWSISVFDASVCSFSSMTIKYICITCAAIIMCRILTNIKYKTLKFSEKNCMIRGKFYKFLNVFPIFLLKKKQVQKLRSNDNFLNYLNKVQTFFYEILPFTKWSIDIY